MRYHPTMDMKSFLTDTSLDYAYFHCCGDEDLYPFHCPQCWRLMVFCYECDTLYPDLENLSEKTHELNHFNPDKPIFACPGCGYNFEYYFMRDQKYRVSFEAWINAGFEHLLASEK